jgi:hypothetical protein
MTPFQNANDSQFLAASFQTAVSAVCCGDGDCSERVRWRLVPRCNRHVVQFLKLPSDAVNEGECLLLKSSSKSSPHKMEHSPRVPGGPSVILYLITVIIHGKKIQKM